MSAFPPLLEQLIVKNLWVLSLLVFGFALYSEGRLVQEKERLELEEKKKELTAQLSFERERNLYLHDELASLNDIDWLELTLKKGLGVVPEGQKKVYFYPKKEAQ